MEIKCPIEKTLKHAKLILLIDMAGMQLGRPTPSLPFFENRRECPEFGKKGPDCVHHWVTFFIQNVVSKVSRRKISNIFHYRVFFSCF